MVPREGASVRCGCGRARELPVRGPQSPGRSLHARLNQSESADSGQGGVLVLVETAVPQAASRLVGLRVVVQGASPIPPPRQIRPAEYERLALVDAFPSVWTPSTTRLALSCSIHACASPRFLWVDCFACAFCRRRRYESGATCTTRCKTGAIRHSLGRCARPGRAR